ncbi:nucleotidyltransferase family protein [Candidatus Woesearchaeota archaeon]|nr:nucleotidyltransferase family protein [Candidatus Woesearchaeota archaeon]
MKAIVLAGQDDCRQRDVEIYNAINRKDFLWNTYKPLINVGDGDSYVPLIGRVLAALDQSTSVDHIIVAGLPGLENIIDVCQCRTPVTFVPVRKGNSPVHNFFSAYGQAGASGHALVMACDLPLIHETGREGRTAVDRFVDRCISYGLEHDLYMGIVCQDQVGRLGLDRRYFRLVPDHDPGIGRDQDYSIGRRYGFRDASIFLADGSLDSPLLRKNFGKAASLRTYPGPWFAAAYFFMRNVLDITNLIVKYKLGSLGVDELEHRAPKIFGASLKFIEIRGGDAAAFALDIDIKDDLQKLREIAESVHLKHD